MTALHRYERVKDIRDYRAALIQKKAEVTAKLVAVEKEITSLLLPGKGLNAA